MSYSAGPCGGARPPSGQDGPGRHCAPASPPSLSGMRVFLLFFFAGAVLYFQTAGCPFLWDEYRLILGNATAGAFRWDRLPALFCQRYFHLQGSFKNDLPLDLYYYRPVTLLFHGLSYRAFGQFFPIYHLESLFLHVGNAMLLFSLARTLLGRRLPPADGESIALAGALIFLVHPRNVETVSIIANQTGLLCSFFCLASLVLWARALEGAGRSFLLYCLSVTTLLLGMLCKETAYGVPFLHGLVLLLLGRRDRKALLLLSGFFLLPAVPLLIRHNVLGGRSIFEAFAKQFSRQGKAWGYLASVLGLLFHQLYTWFVPLDIQFFQYPFSTRELSPEQILMPLAVLLLFVWRLRRHREILLFGAGLFFVFYLPSSNLIAMGTLPGGDLKAGAHHLYPAHAGLCLLLAASLLVPVDRRTSERTGRGAGRVPRIVLVLLVLLLALQTFRFAAHFRTADRFYRSLLGKRPLYTAAWTNYAWHKLYVDKAPLRSECILLEGLEAVGASRNPAEQTDLIHNLVVLYLENGRRTEAETLLQCVMEAWVRDPVRSLYFWHLVRMKDEIDERTRGGEERHPDRGG